MIRAASEPGRSASGDHRIKLRSGSKTFVVGPERALSLAHALLKAKKYGLAARICEGVLDGGSKPRGATILLACCKAGLQDYAACNQILQGIFADGKTHLAERLQAALVFQSLGMMPDAVSELVAVVDEVPDLSIIWLLLGDLYVAKADHGKAVTCWRLAAERDVRGGPVALAAVRELAQISKSKRSVTRNPLKPGGANVPAQVNGGRQHGEQTSLG